MHRELPRGSDAFVESTRVLLARHGQTDANASMVFQGQGGGPLNAEGRAQADRLAARLVGKGVSVVVSSDLERAVQTAGIVAARLDLAPSQDPALREIDVGAWSGCSLDEVKVRFPEEYARWHAGDDLRRGGGETYAELARRMREVVVRIAESNAGRTVLVVSHGAALRALASDVLKIAPPGPKSLVGMRNTALAELAPEDGGLRLVSWNDAAHLEE